MKNYKILKITTLCALCSFVFGSENDTVDISGLPKEDVLRCLYDVAKPQGCGFSKYSPDSLTHEKAVMMLRKARYFDYVKGRVLKVNLSGDTFNSYLFNLDNGANAAEQAVSLLKTKMQKELTQQLSVSESKSTKEN